MSKEIKIQCHDCGRQLTTYTGNDGGLLVKPCGLCLSEAELKKEEAMNKEWRDIVASFGNPTCHDCGGKLIAHKEDGISVEPCEKCAQDIKREAFQDGYAAGQMAGCLEKKPRKFIF